MKEIQNLPHLLHGIGNVRINLYHQANFTIKVENILFLFVEDLVQLSVKEKLLQHERLHLEVEVAKVVALCGDFTVKTHLD